MSFTPASGGVTRALQGRTARAFELVRRSLLQKDGLLFADALTAEQMRQAFDDEGGSFGDATPTSSPTPTASATATAPATPSATVTNLPETAAHGGADGATVYTPAVMLWAILSQALLTDVQRSCRAAVQRVAVYWALLGREVSSSNTGAYCRARSKVTEGVVRRLAEGVAERCEASVPEEWRWHGFRTLLIDGTTFSMPDTEQNQAEYPQPSSQEEGLGFPILRAVALTSLATGMVLSLAMGPYAGKETGETALFRSLFQHLQRGDLILADRYYGGWFMLALLRELGVEFVTRLHQHRDADFRRGRRLGKGDHLVAWPKPQRPAWLDQETYDRLPAELEVREIEVRVDVPGFRTESLIVVTSLAEAQVYTRDDIASLDRRRWMVELQLRDIKTTMDLSILRRKHPAAVRQELWTGLLTYNLIRQSLLQSAQAAGRKPDQLSFAAALQLLANTWVLAAPPLPEVSSVLYTGNEQHRRIPHGSTDNPPPRDRLITLRILNGHSHRVGHRPNRVEPRAVKRRPTPLALLTEPRTAAQTRLLTTPNP